MNLDRSWGLAVVDLHPYDGTLAKSVCNLYMAPEKLPFVMCVSPVWAKLGAVNDPQDVMDANRIEQYCCKHIHLHARNAFKGGRLLVPGLEVPKVPDTSSTKPPVYDETKFVITRPNANGHLPVRQATKFQIQMVMASCANSYL